MMIDQTEIKKSSLIDTITKIEDSEKVDYSFDIREIKLLAKFFRDHETELPEGLENFTKLLEDSLYSCLSLDEVRKFYS